MCLKVSQFLLFIFIGLFSVITFAATYPMPSASNDIIGENFYAKTEPGDTLASVGLVMA